MQRRTIAIDCDDVLADHAEDVVDWTNQRFGTNLTISDYTDHWHLLWATDHAETEKLAHEYHATGRHTSFNHKPDSLEVLKELSKCFDLVVVTARRKEIVKTSLEWIEHKYPGIFKDIRFVPIWEPYNLVSKADICREIDASYLIDDLPRHCNIAAKVGIKSLVFGDYNWNRDEVLVDGVQRVKNWQEVRDFFDNEA